MKLVLDTNVLISALLKSSATRAILLHPSFEFFLPEFGLEEIRRHKPELRKRSRLTEDALDLLLSLLLERVTIVPAAVIESHLKHAERLIGRRDPGDIPFASPRHSHSATMVSGPTIMISTTSRKSPCGPHRNSSTI